MIVSHSTGSLKETCERVLWVHKGELIADGPTDDVIDEYIAWTKNPGSNAVGAASAPKPSTKNAPIAVGFDADGVEQSQDARSTGGAPVAAALSSGAKEPRALARRDRHRRAERRTRKRSVLLMVLSGVAVLLAVAAGAIIGTLSSVAAPVDAEPSARPTPEQSTPAAVPVIKSFTANAATVECASEEAEGQVLLSWHIDDAESVAIAAAETQVDALELPLAAALPANLTDRAVPFSCATETVVYTVTAENEDGVRVSAPVTVTRVLPVETEEPDDNTAPIRRPSQTPEPEPVAPSEPAPPVAPEPPIEQPTETPLPSTPPVEPGGDTGTEPGTGTIIP